MGRMGCWQEEAVAEFEKIARIPRLKVHSISTHLPVADEDENFTREELARFEALVRQMRTRVPDGYKVHVLPSAGILGYAPSGLEMVRAGLMLYGSSPLPNEQRWLQPAMTWKTRIALLRDVPAGRSVSYGRTFVTPRSMRLATIGVGYADGFPRALSGRDAVVLIRETRCPIVGRITMDLTVVEVSAVPEAEVGDEVVLIGRQGAEEIFAAEVAARAGTIAWEIFTGIGSRVRRVYL
jgi:alanine racemase